MAVRLLILDFHGVCTYSAAELVAMDGDPGDLAGSVRNGAAEVVSEAQRAGVVVAVLSNDLDRSWADRVPILEAVDHVVVCSDNGIYKPDRRAFQRCLLLAGADAESTVAVDDNADNANVAAALGMTAILFDTGLEDPWSAVRRALLH